MYLDVRGLVTTAIGYLCDPIELALPLPWQSADGSQADQNAIGAAWQLVKSNLSLAHEGAYAAMLTTSLRLSDKDIQTLTLSTLDRYEAILMGYSAFSGLDNWPADAQLGLLSMAWAMGPGLGRKFPHFSSACSAADWNAAAAQCWINAPGDAAVARRNQANQTAFKNAAKVTAAGGDYSALTEQ